MDEPLDEQYLSWLYARVASVKVTNPTRTYWSLFRYLYTKEFVWLVPNDDNRVEDGRDLRYEFQRYARVDIDPDWLGLGCSVLELLIAVARRAAFEDGMNPREWFWKLIKNLGLEKQTDARFDHDYTEDVVDGFIWRTYDSNGHGGLFPLRGPCQDQRNVEIWYQLCAYILEQE